MNHKCLYLSVAMAIFVFSAAVAQVEYKASFSRSAPAILKTGVPLQKTPAALPGIASREIVQTIEGIDFDQNGVNNGGALFIPPDPHGAAGPGHLVAVVNVSIEWYTKGGALQHSESLKTFFGPVSPVGFPFDPKVIYDQHEDRFVVVALDTDFDTYSSILVAVSDNSDPNGTWYFHKINSLTPINGRDSFADYPGLGIDDKAVYITNNMFSSSAYEGTRLWIVHKGAGTGGFYDGGIATVTRQNPTTGNVYRDFSMQPAHVFGTPPAGMGTFIVTYYGQTDGKNEFLTVIRIEDPLGTPTFSNQSVNTGDIDASPEDYDTPDAPQAGTSTRIETNDRRALNAVWRDNALWVTAQVVPPVGIDAGQTTAHWWKLDTSAGPVAVLDQGDVGGEEIAAGAHTFFPAIAVNINGEAAIGFALSAPTIYCGAYAVSITANGSTRPARTVAAGLDFYIRTFGGSDNRWGDYSGISVDPADSTTFWVYNEYAIPRGTPAFAEDGRWGTRFAQLRTDSSTLAAPGNLEGNIANTLVSLSWQDNSDDETGFEIERKQGAGAFVRIATTGADTTQFQDLVKRGERFVYRVRAINSFDFSDYSNNLPIQSKKDRDFKCGATGFELVVFFLALALLRKRRSPRN